MADHSHSDPDAPTVVLDTSSSGVAALMRDIIAEGPLVAEEGDNGSTIILNARERAAIQSKFSKERAGTQIGNYVLKQELGRGGFGTVWWAEQVAPFRRDVALKIILHGMDTEEVLARFDAEKRLLAKMDHTNIAAVYDAGTTESGRPYFVMELVKGVNGPGKPITSYCDEKQLPVRERIQLFISVCQAVQHAHMKQVLHRDLKPTNILVSEVDGVPVPKIIDFGIAKAMSPDDEALLASRMRTAQDMVIGTLQYMSPEQAGSEADIDTRSDVYTLGVILYELLVGEPPIGREDVKKAVFDVLQQIRNVSPPRRPSTRWLSATAAMTRHALSTRCANPRKLTQQINGDLDWIVMKALEKDRTRRYSAATDLADDLGHFLRNEPVSAGPPSSLYRLKKVIQRHKVVFATMTTVLAAIIIGGGVAFWQWQEAVKARIAAEHAREQAVMHQKEAQRARELEAGARVLEAQARKVADDQRQIAETSRAQAERERGVAESARTQAEDLINYMLFDLRDKLEPLNRIALLDDVATKAERYFDAQPEDAETDAQRRNRGGMWQNRGQIALAMGRTEEAAKGFESFHRIMAKRVVAEPQDRQRIKDLAVADGRMSLVHEQGGRMTEALASAMAEHQAVQALAQQDKDDHDLIRHLASTYERLGDLERRQSNLEKAAGYYREGRAALERLMGVKAPEKSTRMAMATLCERQAELHQAVGQKLEALKLFAQEVSTFEALQAEAPADPGLRRALAVALQKKAGVLADLGETTGAETHNGKALQILEELSNADPGNLNLLHELALSHAKTAEMLTGLGREADALPHWNRDMEISVMLAGADPGNARWQSELAVSHWQLAQCKLRQGSRVSVADAVKHFQTGRNILADLKQGGRIDAAGTAWLASFEKAIQESSALGK